MWRTGIWAGLTVVSMTLPVFRALADTNAPPEDPERQGPGMDGIFDSEYEIPDYKATRNHLQVGFRWQPYPGRPKNSEHDISLELGRVASYASFWYMLVHTLPEEENLDYADHPSEEALAIRHAVKLCKERGIKTELIIWQVPLWMNGGETYDDFRKMPDDPQQIYDVVRATVEWFGEDVDYYGLFHEANHPKYWEGSDDELIEYYVLPAARAIRDYGAETGDKKVVSTAGLSPSRNCRRWYDVQLENPELMGLIDNFALNLSDFSNGWGGGWMTFVGSCWSQLDYMRRSLDEGGYPDKGLAGAESWICWDGTRTPHGPEATGDPVESTLRIFGECLQRGLSLANLPWADNNSTWTIGLTKRLDYNGALAALGEELFPNAFGGAPIAARKLNVVGSDDETRIENEEEWFDNATFGAPYAVPDDPNHTHYYIWRWYAQLSAGRHECVHHAIAGESGNDIVITGADPEDLLRVCSYDRTAKRFIVLIARRAADGPPQDLLVQIPARIQKGARYHRDGRFDGEGMRNRQRYRVRWTSEEIDPTTGYRRDKHNGESSGQMVRAGTLTAAIPGSRRFTTIVFEQP
jgi:hypothetical protein